MANKLRKKLSKLVNKDLYFVDENDNQTPGTWMYLSETNQNKHFFVPYDMSTPFRISLNGKNKIYIDFKNNTVYGSSEHYYNLATKEELNSLAESEAILNLTNPLSEVQGKGSSSLIKISHLEVSESKNFPLFKTGFGVGI